MATEGVTKRMDWVETLICKLGFAAKQAAKVSSIAGALGRRVPLG